ncbi:MAG TPA: methyl-accepting chemotaxis protein [Paenibacillus sp.]|nr:methyl-accepting chemotaxis protein [Paenibacillus sp.]
MSEKKTLLSPPTYAKIGQDDPVPRNVIRTDAADGLEPATGKRLQEQRMRARTFAKYQQLSERLAAASQQLSAGVEESQTAMQELRQAMEQLVTGAEESSAACEESSASITKIMDNMNAITHNVALSMNRSLTIQQIVAGSSTDIHRLVEGVMLSAAKSSDSARSIVQLERQAQEIGDIIGTVVHLADQTNLLALNAAIEAARAGEHGAGFAIVADEVRALAELSEKSANDIRRLVSDIQSEVAPIAASIRDAERIALEEADKGRGVVESLQTVGEKLEAFVQSVKDVNGESLVLRSGIRDFENGARVIAQASEEQATGAAQALQAILQQSRALQDINHSALELSDLTEDLRSSKNVARSAETLAAAAEELSASITEAGQSAQQIMYAINGMDRSSEMQSVATEQSATAVTQLEQMTKKVSELAGSSEEHLSVVAELYDQGKRQTDSMIENITAGLRVMEDNLDKLVRLEGQFRSIDKIVNAIDRVGIQTNMLAVNGAIEAAGAGKFGRGFAVVAADIRSLAVETAGHAENIKDLIRDTQMQVSTVLRELHVSKETTKAEVEKARRILTDSVRIEDDLLHMKSMIADNAGRLNEMEFAINESKRAVDQIAVTSAESAAASKQAAHAGQEQNIGINELARAIEEIASMADDIYL